MASQISFNPMLTTTVGNGFGIQSEGYVQGQALDDPAIRYQLANGVLASTETFPMWGGVAIYENIPNPGLNNVLGGNVGRATSNANITGFSVFNQGHAMVNWPQNQVPIALPSMSVPLFRLGSGARIPVACDPSLASLQGGLINQQVTWDINNQVLQPYDASTATYSLTSITSSYSASTGLYTFAVVAAVATLVGGVGDSINIGGVTGTGAALVNGDQVVTAWTDSQHFSFQVAAAVSAIATGALSGTLVLNSGTGALNVKVLEVNVGNSKTVVWSPTLLTANWNFNGTVAIIQI